jgi:ribosomal protein S12 methylthiotransferase
MVSLGCAKNTVDSERVLGMLAERGFTISADPEDADVVLVNTCAFIGPAREETEDTLRSLGRGKKGPAVVALGCYPERAARPGTAPVYSHPEFPQVEAFVRFEAYDDLAAICARLAGVTRDGPRSERSCFGESARLRIGSPASAYLKIAEGCSNRCRYCTIPDIRGPLRSFPLEELLDEARGLVGIGTREICVIAQDTASYGTDLHGEPRLPDLVRGLVSIERLRWVRLLYVHPAHLTEDILDVMAGEEKVCDYLDLPTQHVATRVLDAMGRGYGEDDLRRLVARARERLPSLTLRTSMIVGFPGETDREFDHLVDFVRETRFDHLGAFAYSPEEGTPAARLAGQVPPEVSEERYDRLMRAQQDIAFEALDSRVDGEESVMLELPTEMAGVWAARSAREAPEVDGSVIVRLEPHSDASPGDFSRVKIDERDGYDLLATPVDGPAVRKGRRRPK